MSFVTLRIVCKPASNLILNRFHSSSIRGLSSLPIRQAFEHHEIVPDVIQSIPNNVINVKYQKDLKVKFGNVLKPSDVRSIPIEVKWQTEENALYTLCLTDPDAPTRSKPEFREWHHWLVVNIPGNNIAAGDTLSAYIGSGPPKGSGLHRYVFLAYKQPGRIDIDQEPKLGNRSDVGRGLFSITRFAQRHFLGTPVAGNFYQAQWDEYVPELEKQLSGQ